MADKSHVSVVIAGHVDAGKSTTTGRLLFELGGISEREMEKLKAEAEKMGKGSFAFAFYMDNNKEERERGVTINCACKEFFTDNYHYTIVDAPGHHSYVSNMISGSSQADVAVLMVPADGNFATSIAKGDHKAGEIQGQTRQHARLLNLLGVKQLIVCVNKMDSDTAKYSEERYNEVRDEMVGMLEKVGWKKNKKDEFVQKSVPIIPISGYKGDNLIKQSDKMPWWKGVDVQCLDGSTTHVHTLLDALNNMVKLPPRNPDAPLRVPLSGIYNIKGVGTVLAGRVEQGTVKPGDEVIFLPTHTASAPCTGKVQTVEMHHKSVEKANTGDNVGMNIKGLNKSNMPRKGDVMVLKGDTSVGRCKSFTTQVQVLDHPGELKVGYSPMGCVRTAHSAIKIAKINWKMGKETGGVKLEDPPFVKANEMAEIVFEPQQPLVVEEFSKCEGLGRVAVMEGNGVVMLGKAISVEKVVDDAGAKKK